MKYTQIPLPVKLHQTARFAGFLGEKNKVVVHQIKDESNKLIYLQGASQSGKSFLLQACCSELSSNSIYLPMQELIQHDTKITENLENYQLICIDDIEQIINSAEWQRALFNLYNLCVTKKSRLIIASQLIPTQILNILPDLQSRLSAMLFINIQDLSDEEKINYLIQRANAYGMALSTEAARFIVTRYQRGLAPLNQLLEKLDHETLSAKRKLTLPFIREVIEF